MSLPFPHFHNQKGQTGLITESITDLLIVDEDLPQSRVQADCPDRLDVSAWLISVATDLESASEPRWGLWSVS